MNRLGLELGPAVLLPEAQREPRAVENPIVGIEVAVFVEDGAGGFEDEAQVLDRVTNGGGVAPLGDSKLDLLLEHRRPRPQAAPMSRSAPGWISHSRVALPAAGSRGRVMRLAPPFLYSTKAAPFFPARRYEVKLLRWGS